MEAPVMTNVKTNILRNLFVTGLVSLAIVALYGVTMRYKILYNLPFFEQKNLLHAHSHFAFSGWITHILLTGICFILWPYLPKEKKKKYPILIIVNLLIAYGMLVSFTMQGYAFYSILFSTLSIFIIVVFTIYYVRDVNKYARNIRFRRWAVYGLYFNILSSAGPFFVAYTMIVPGIHHHLTLAGVYYYLHFQYNGWFFFGTMALVVTMLPDLPSLTKFLNLFTVIVIPTFLLSILWAGLPMWLYLVALVSIAIEYVSWILFLVRVGSHMKISHIDPKWVRLFFYCAIIALTLKFTLQTISVIPSLSQLVFGYRSIVIGYLHLVLLGGYTLFILGFLFYNDFMHTQLSTKIGAFIFLVGVIFNEFVLLGIQGFTALFTSVVVPYVNEMLLIAALMLFGGALIMAVSQILYRRHELHEQQIHPMEE